MKATELLTTQHREVSRLFKAIESADGAAEKRQLFEKLASNLVAHDGIERDIFYPACEEAMGMNDLLGEALVEHGMIEFGVYQASESLGADDFDYKCKVLGEMVEHHVFMGALKTVPAKDPDGENTEIKRSKRGSGQRKQSKLA